MRASEVHGLATNRDMLVRVLEHPAFLQAEADTGFLERADDGELVAPLPGAGEEALHAAAAALAAQAERRAIARVLGSLPSGWRNNPSQLQQIAFAAPRGALDVRYRFDRDGALSLQVGDDEIEAVRVGACRPDLVELEADGVLRSYRVRRDGATWWVNGPHGQSELRELDRFPGAAGEDAAGSLSSPMPGVVVRVLAEPGARVGRGTPLVVIEAMKMEHEIVAPADGTVAELPVAEGEQVEAGALLVVIDEDGDGAV
jgi:propionyl-CoA carboxylase alpha chain